MSLKGVLFGRPLATWEEGGQRVGPVAGIPVPGLDALASAAYGPETAMTLLLLPQHARHSLRRSDHRGRNFIFLSRILIRRVCSVVIKTHA